MGNNVFHRHLGRVSQIQLVIQKSSTVYACSSFNTGDTIIKLQILVLLFLISHKQNTFKYQKYTFHTILLILYVMHQH